MRRFLFAAVLLSLATAPVFSEAVVLPEGSSISTPDGISTTLQSSAFLLDRADMEAATLALETVGIQARALERYAARERWLVPVAAVSGAALGVLITILIQGVAR